MTHTYNISGMTCGSCVAKVAMALQKVEGVHFVNIDLQKNEAEISMTKHVSTDLFKEALKSYPQYRISEKADNKASMEEEEGKNWFQTYKPVLLIFTYITGVTLAVQFTGDSFSYVRWMNNFMAGFFLCFSFFKLLNLPGFAENYAGYDIIAKRWKGYGYLYAILELILGLFFLTGRFSLTVNIITLILMSISLIGVVQSVLNKRKIKCACLGDVFNLPMSTITILEDLTMILMSGSMVVYLLQT